MITPKQWKAFNKYRDDLLADWYLSEGYSKYLKTLGSGPSLILPEEHFRLVYFKKDIPDKTIEACLDWLVNE